MRNMDELMCSSDPDDKATSRYWFISTDDQRQTMFSDVLTDPERNWDSLSRRRTSGRLCRVLEANLI